MTRGILGSLPEDKLNEWLDEATYDDLLLLAKLCRVRLHRAVVDADKRGDGPLVNALCPAMRRVFGPNSDWQALG